MVCLDSMTNSHMEAKISECHNTCKYSDFSLFRHNLFGGIPKLICILFNQFMYKIDDR